MFSYLRTSVNLAAKPKVALGLRAVTFAQRPLCVARACAPELFNDLVAFVPLTKLMNRMVVSGKLP